MSNQFNNHPLLDLQNLLSHDSVEISRLQQEFENHGWCFVRLSKDLRSYSTQINDMSQAFFDFFSLNQSEKLRYQTSNAFGYSSVGHKEGIKLLTTQQGGIRSIYSLPMNIDTAVRHVSQLVSHLTFQLKPIILQLMAIDLKQSKHVQIADLAMLDIVHYFNKNAGPKTVPEVGYDTNDVNCVPHYDPGLFSLSILSTSDGLQLKDQLTNQWIDGPYTTQLDRSNIGVIWLGEAASILTNNRFKAGIHRVIYPRTPHQARLTIWQEICTESQIDQLFGKNAHEDRLPQGALVKLANQPNSKPMAVQPGGETRFDFMKRVEADRGLSMSKSGVSDIRVYTNPSDDQNKQSIPPNRNYNNQNGIYQSNGMPNDFHQSNQTSNNFCAPKRPNRKQ